MCDAAYHHEALRKARLIQRKQENQGPGSAQARGSGLIQTRPPPDVLNDPRRLQRLDSGYRSCQYDRGLWGHDAADSARHSYTHLKYEKGRGDTSALHPGWPTVYRELKQHDKCLRNHNMYMGPLSAFADLFDNSRYQKYSRYAGSSEPRY